MVCSPDGDTDFFDSVAGVLHFSTSQRSFVCTQLNDFNYGYLTLVVLFTDS